MHQGQLRCLGSVQHLKSKYLGGYTIDLFCTADASDDDVEHIVQELAKEAGWQVTDRHGRFVRLNAANLASSGLGGVFRRLHSLKNGSDGKLDKYCVSQCSLEEVFIKLLNPEQSADDGEEPEQP